MSAGEGIIWATVLILLAIGVWRTTVNRRWKLVGRVSIFAVAIVCLIAATFWGIDYFKNRPKVTTELAGARLGMTPVEATLALGKAAWITGPAPPARGQAEASLVYGYEKSYDPAYTLELVFFERDGGVTMSIACESGGYSRLLGFSTGSTEEAILKRLGPPDTTSIAGNGLRKAISYPKWKVAYVLERGRVASVCISSSGYLSYADAIDKDQLPNPFDQFDSADERPVGDAAASAQDAD